MENTTTLKNNDFFDNFLQGLLSMPGVKVKRDEFIKQTLAKHTASFDLIEKAVEVGVLKAGFSRARVDVIAKKVMNENVFDCTKYSFIAGIPGGAAMVATIPADTAQFYAHSLILAQKLAYLYGYDDLWNGEMNHDESKNQMMLFLGVMFGVSGSAATLKVVTANLSKQAVKKLPQKALMKTFYYPIIKKIGKLLGVNITKQSFAKGVSKVIPVLGGVISGGITFASLSAMGEKLRLALSDGTNEDYIEKHIEEDIQIVNEEVEAATELTVDNSLEDIGNDLGDEFMATSQSKSVVDVIEQIEKLNKLKEISAITLEEYDVLKIQLMEANSNN